jgi:hypothetical protein
MFRMILVAVLLLCLNVSFSHSFLPLANLKRERLSFAQSDASWSLLKLASEDASTAEKDVAPESRIEDEGARGSTTTLTLVGKLCLSTKPLPSCTPEKILQFLQTPEYRNMLLTSGGERPVEELELTPNLLSEWKTACDKVGAKHPDSDDVILSIKTPGIDFPGLKITSLAKIGTKFILESEPFKSYYEFTGIADETTAEGLKPVVWIYNTLTGAGKKDEKSRTSFSSLSRFSCEKTGDDTIVFKSDVFLSVGIKFPSILLKILPTNKEKAEVTGGQAIVKALEKDLTKALSGIEEAYQKMLD